MVQVFHRVEKVAVNDDFAGKTFGSSGPSMLTYTTDGFRVYNRWSNDRMIFIQPQRVQLASPVIHLIEGLNFNVRMAASYRTMLMVPGNQSDSSSNTFYVDRNDSNVTPVDEAEVWWKEMSLDYYCFISGE